MVNIPQKIGPRMKPGTGFLLLQHRLEIARLGIVVQSERIQNAVQTYGGMDPNRIYSEEEIFEQGRPNYWVSRANRVFLELHYLFTSICNAVYLMQEMASICPETVLEEHFNHHREFLHRFPIARHTFEHFPDKVPGGKYEIAEPYFELAYPVFTFGGEKWDIGPTTIDRLIGIVDEFFLLIHSEAFVLHPNSPKDTGWATAVFDAAHLKITVGMVFPQVQITDDPSRPGGKIASFRID